ncbi:hypothetical protein SLA2020_423130 [Shorea laevis]
MADVGGGGRSSTLMMGGGETFWGWRWAGRTIEGEFLGEIGKGEGRRLEVVKMAASRRSRWSLALVVGRREILGGNGLACRESLVQHRF